MPPSPQLSGLAIVSETLSPYLSKVYFCTNWLHANISTFEGIEEKFLKLGVIKDQWCCDAMS